MRILFAPFKTALSSARNGLSETLSETKELYKEYNIFKYIRETFPKTQKAPEKERVFTKEINDNSIKSIVDTSKSGLEAYAKANNINISFYSPKNENRLQEAEKSLRVLVEKQNPEGYNSSERVINGDINRIYTHAEKRVFPTEDQDRIVYSSYEDPFIRYVYRTVEELNKDIS